VRRRVITLATAIRPEAFELLQAVDLRLVGYRHRLLVEVGAELACSNSGNS
jgi:hypothetical protein